MEFVSVSKRWKILETQSAPEGVATSLMEQITKHLPSDALGHAKLYVEYDGGALFASTTLIPPDISIRHQGQFGGGDMTVNVTLIFGDLTKELLADALWAARRELEAMGLYRLEEIGAEHGTP